MGRLVINPFLESCGASGPLLLNIEAPGVTAAEARAFDLPFVMVGRDPRSDLRLIHPEISERHAYFQMVDGQLLFMDLGSRTGIHLGGRCHRLGDLDRDQSLRIGPYRIRLIAGDRLDRGRDSTSCPPLTVELSHRSVRMTRCELPRGLALVGNASDCLIRLVDPSLSNYHCSLIHTPSGVWVVDLFGDGGVRINGQDVSYAQVHEGDSIQVGHSTIRIMSSAEPAIIAAFDARIPNASLRIVEPTPVFAQDLDTVSTSPNIQTVEMIERILSPMLSQAGLSRQEIVDEFHQTREMLLTSFATLRQEQNAFIHQELEQIRQLSQELHALRVDLEQKARLLAEQAANLTTASSARQSSRLGTASASSRVETKLPLPGGRADVPALLSLLGHGNGHGRGHLENHGNGRAKSHVATESTRDPGLPRTIPPEAANEIIAAHNEQAHAKLCLRIASLKRKQQTRWEKMLAMLPSSRTPAKPKRSGDTRSPSP